MEKIRVMPVDDSLEFFEGAARLLDRIPGLDVVAWMCSGSEALDLLRHAHADLVFMDLVMPGLSGLEATRRIRSLPEPPKLVALMLHGNAQHCVAAANAGADRFLSRSEFGNRAAPLVRALFPGAGAEVQ